MPLEFDDHPFWDYSLRTYAGAGVAAACIALQDRFGIDVNMMLFCSWIGHSGRGVMTGTELSAVRAAGAAWNEQVVGGLRMVRQTLKGGMPPAPREMSDALRRRILDIEVDSEHAEQLMLADAIDRPASGSIPAGRRAADAVANIAAYLETHGAAPDETDVGNLAVVLGAAFTDCERGEVDSLCRELFFRDGAATP